jgi:hypothetical protein
MPYTPAHTFSPADVGSSTSDLLNDAFADVAAYADTVGGGGAGVFNVKSYGAVGDDATDDTTAIQDAYDAAGEGDTVYFPGGTYRVTATISVPTGVITVGSAQYRTLVRMDDATNLDAVMATAEWLGSGTTVGSPSSFRHICIDANKANQSGGDGHGLVVSSYWTSVLDCVFENALGDGLRITNTRQDGVEMSGSSTMVETYVWHCHVRDCDGYCIRVFDTTPTSNAVTDGWIVDCVIKGTPNDGVYIDSSAGWAIKGNHFYSTQENAIRVERAAAISVTDNYFESWGYSTTAGGYAAVSLGPYIVFYYPCVVANNRGFNTNGTWNASSNLYAIRAEVANGQVGNLTVTGNAFHQDTFTNSFGIRFQNQGATATFRGTFSGNHFQGFTTKYSPVKNAGTMEIRGDIEQESQAIAYAGTITPDPYKGGRVVVGTLTNNITVNAPADAHAGGRLSFVFTQDGTGGWAVNFNAAFKVNWTPTTTAGKINTIEFEYNGTNWIQMATGIGL